MEIPSYLLPQPPLDLTPEKTAAFDALFNSTPAGQTIDYTLPYPKWQYLTYICTAHQTVLHGSQQLQLSKVEPRQAKDIKTISAQNAIYATTDGIWVMYFAILDRQGVPMSLFNSCLQARIAPDQLSEPLYFFSITQSAKEQNPWREGAVYILPRIGFEQEPAQQVQGIEIVFPHWFSRKPAKPITILRVSPSDFPFLDRIHGHNDERLRELAVEDPAGFPWLEALES